MGTGGKSYVRCHWQRTEYKPPNFFAKDPSNFNSKSMELIIAEVDSHVDRTLGRSQKTFKDSKGMWHSDLTFLLKIKYIIIFQIANNLPPEVQLMKDYILQTVANILDDLELLISISDFQDNLTTEFEKRGNLQQYKTFLVPTYKKSLTVNETKVNPDKKKDTKIDPAVAKTGACVAFKNGGGEITKLGKL